MLVALYGATAGKTGILSFDSTTNQAICAIVPKSNEINVRFLFWFFRSKRYHYINISKGGAQPNISQNIINETRVMIENDPLRFDEVSVYFYEFGNSALVVRVIYFANTAIWKDYMEMRERINYKTFEIIAKNNINAIIFLNIIFLFIKFT